MRLLCWRVSQKSGWLESRPARLTGSLTHYCRPSRFCSIWQAAYLATNHEIFWASCKCLLIILWQAEGWSSTVDLLEILTADLLTAGALRLDSSSSPAYTLAWFHMKRHTDSEMCIDHQVPALQTINKIQKNVHHTRFYLSSILDSKIKITWFKRFRRLKSPVFNSFHDGSVRCCTEDHFIKIFVCDALSYIINNAAVTAGILH